MSTVAKQDPDAGYEPAFAAPKNACDAHFHVFGREEQYPYYTLDLRYKPPYEPLEAYMKLARRLGFERFVFVQPSAYGFDNSCMLDAMAEVAPELRRGVVHLDETKANDAVLGKWHAQGVRGVRINVSPVRKSEAGFADHLRPKIVRTAAICRELGWHLDFLLPGWLTAELLDRIDRLRVEATLAHMGMFLAKDGLKQPGFQRLLKSRCWVKLTGIYRMSQAPGFADAAPMARALIEANPDRLIWGSDYPHLSFADQVGSVLLFNLLAGWAPEEAARRRILVDNPAVLFGF